MHSCFYIEIICFMGSIYKGGLKPQSHIWICHSFLDEFSVWLDMKRMITGKSRIRIYGGESP